MSYPINPPTHVGECATCGRMQELEICEGCETQAEKDKAPYIALWAALAVDAELQRSFDYGTEGFDSGHLVYVCGDAWTLKNQSNETMEYGTMLDIIEWCVANREVLV